MCANTAASLWRERPECLSAGEIMTPLTGLIHTQLVEHPEKNVRKSSQQRIGCVSWKEVNTFRLLALILLKEGWGNFLHFFFVEKLGYLSAIRIKKCWQEKKSFATGIPENRRWCGSQTIHTAVWQEMPSAVQSELLTWRKTSTNWNYYHPTSSFHPLWLNFELEVCKLSLFSLFSDIFFYLCNIFLPWISVWFKCRTGHWPTWRPITLTQQHNSRKPRSPEPHDVTFDSRTERPAAMMVFLSAQTPFCLFISDFFQGLDSVAKLSALFSPSLASRSVWNSNRSLKSRLSCHTTERRFIWWWALCCPAETPTSCLDKNWEKRKEPNRGCDESWVHQTLRTNGRGWWWWWRNLDPNCRK